MRFLKRIDRGKDGGEICFDTSLADGVEGADVRNTFGCCGYDNQPKI